MSEMILQESLAP